MILLPLLICCLLQILDILQQVGWRNLDNPDRSITDLTTCTTLKTREHKREVVGGREGSKKKSGRKMGKKKWTGSQKVTERKSRATTVLSKHDTAALILHNENSTMEVRECELCNTGLQLKQWHSNTMNGHVRSSSCNSSRGPA